MPHARSAYSSSVAVVALPSRSLRILGVVVSLGWKARHSIHLLRAMVDVGAMSASREDSRVKVTATANSVNSDFEKAM